MAFIARQPNGLLCRYSGIIESITHYNMTDEEYIELCAERGRQEAREVLEHYVEPFEKILESYGPDKEMTKEEKDEFDFIMKQMVEPIEN